MIRQVNAQYDSEIAEMMDERVRLERDLTRHHAEIRRVAVAGSSDAATTTLIADLHERIAQATTRNAELAKSGPLVHSLDGSWSRKK